MNTIKSSILTKQVFLASGMLSLLLIASQCNCHKTDDPVYNSQWVRGKSLYLDICTACHIGFYKDTIFKDYVATIHSFPIEAKTNYLVKILVDSNHNRLGLPKYSNKQIANINYYIETPHRKGAVP